MKRLNQKKRKIYFVLLLPLILLLVALAWHIFITNKLYICTDPVPFLTFTPPWVHAQVPDDRYIAPPALLALIWIAMIAVGMLLTYWISKKLTSKADS